jgi:hypothetical protein
MIFNLPDKFSYSRAVPLFLLFVTSVMMLSNCEKENAKPRSYPRITSMPVTNISSTGADCSARIYSLGTEQITDHGFVWGLTDPAIDYSDKVLLGVCDTGLFSARIKTNLRTGIKYYVKPFVRTAKHIVYGVTQEFKSLGSEAPVISGFEPHSGTWLDTLTVTGQNFSWIVNTNTVKLNEIPCEILTSTGTTLKVLVGRDLSAIKSVISVELAGNVATRSQDTFRLIIPVVKDFSPKQARWSDTITLTGSNFVNSRFDMQVSAAIGGYTCPVLVRKSNLIKFQVPAGVNTLASVITVKIHNQNYTLPDKLTLLTPFITSISPKTGTWGTVVTVKGRFHPSSSRNIISIGGITAPLISNNSDSIKFAIPQNLGSPRNVVINTSTPFTIASQDTFKLSAPVIESISPLTGTTGISVTIKGKYLQDGNGASIVRFGTQAATIVGHSSTQLDCRVPANLINGLVNISVTVASQTTVFPTPFDLKNPVITSVYPLNGSISDAVTIEGENLLLGGATAPDVYFTGNSTDIFAARVSSTANKIIVTVPTGLDSIPKKLKFIYRSISLSVISASEFKLNPPVITSVSASVLTPGVDITVYGTGFNPVPGNNQVFWGKYPLTVKSATSIAIVATVPTSIPSGFNKISINVGGYKRVYPTLYEGRSSWTEIAVPGSLLWNSAIAITGGIGFSLNGTGYMIDPVGNMNSFNPVTKELASLGLHQEFKYSQGFAKMILNDTLYAVGYNVTQLDGLFRYDVALNSWIRLAYAPSNYPNGVGFSLNGKLYYGLPIIADNYSLTNLFWVYDRPTKSWVSKQPFPSFSYSRAVASFTIGNRGYVLFRDRVFCEYNPDTDTWTRLASFPANRSDLSGMVFFAMNNKGYVGLGGIYYNNIVYNDLWSFDPAANTWTQSAIIPHSGRYNAVSFVINNKAYMGFGASNNSNLRDFYEYDPNFVAK